MKPLSIVAFSVASLLLLSVLSVRSMGDQPTVASSHSTFVGILKNKCLRCHGDKEVEGDVNLVALLERNLAFGDVADWGKVFSEVQNGNMPPEEEDKPLTPDERKEILSVLQAGLGQSKSGTSRRMITPDEYKNAIADLLRLDLKNYDPFGDLHAFVSPDHHFHTVKSNRMMNRFYLKALMDGTERIIREYNSDNKPLVGNARDPNAKLSEKQREK
jgi:hypothetical protein